MANRWHTRLLIGGLTLALTVPAVSIAQSPPGSPPEAPSGPPSRPGSVTRCTEAAPCATPGARKAPGAKAPSASAIRQFRETHPCPTTAHNWGACPGYVVIHITPPCKGGADAPENLQWQTHAKADRLARTACRPGK